MQCELMNRLQVAMKYNVKENKTLLARGRCKVRLVRIRRDKSVQTGFYRLTNPNLCKTCMVYENWHEYILQTSVSLSPSASA